MGLAHGGRGGDHRTKLDSVFKGIDNWHGCGRSEASCVYGGEAFLLSCGLNHVSFRF